MVQKPRSGPGRYRLKNQRQEDFERQGSKTNEIGRWMRLLVVGAGASYSEGERAGLPEELRPPLIKDFAKRLWSDYNPQYLLNSYLTEQGYAPGEDPRDLFFELESSETSKVNDERFFEFAWVNQNIFPGEWENLLYHGILNPLIFLLSQGLWAKGLLESPMPTAQFVAKHLQSGDAVINLNYETIFEIGATQVGHELLFLPNKPSTSKLLISKPHGSINLVVDTAKQQFVFGELDGPGSPQPADGSRNYRGFVPPRLNKSYNQHPVASAILQATRTLTPHILTFWGVGLTDSDKDLLDLYKMWAQKAKKVEFINPSTTAVEGAQELLGVKVSHFLTVELWETDIGGKKS